MCRLTDMMTKHELLSLILQHIDYLLNNNKYITDKQINKQINDKIICNNK
jgi:hypothetical protein